MAAAWDLGLSRYQSWHAFLIFLHIFVSIPVHHVRPSFLSPPPISRSSDPGTHSMPPPHPPHPHYGSCLVFVFNREKSSALSFLVDSPRIFGACSNPLLSYNCTLRVFGDTLLGISVACCSAGVKGYTAHVFSVILLNPVLNPLGDCFSCIAR